MNEFERDEFIKSIQSITYEKSRHLMDFHVAGFAYYDGLDVIEEMTLGKAVKLISESDNPYDPEAVTIYYKNKNPDMSPKIK